MSDEREKLEIRKLRAEILNLRWIIPAAILTIVGQFYWNRIEIQKREIEVATAELRAEQSVREAAEREDEADAMFNEAQRAVQEASEQVALLRREYEMTQSETQQVSAVLEDRLARVGEAERRLSEVNDRINIVSQRTRETLGQYTVEVESSVESAAVIGQRLGADGFAVSSVNRPSHALDIVFLNSNLPEGLGSSVVNRIVEFDGDIPVCRASMRTSLIAVLGSDAVTVAVFGVSQLGVGGGGAIRHVTPRVRLNTLSRDDCDRATNFVE